MPVGRGGVSAAVPFIYGGQSLSPPTIRTPLRGSAYQKEVLLILPHLRQTIWRLLWESGYATSGPSITCRKTSIPNTRFQVTGPVHTGINKHHLSQPLSSPSTNRKAWLFMGKLEHLAFKPGFETERLMQVNGGKCPVDNVNAYPRWKGGRGTVDIWAWVGSRLICFHSFHHLINLFPSIMRENLPKDIDISRLASTDLLQQHFGRLSTFRPSPALALSFNQAILRISNLTPKVLHGSHGRYQNWPPSSFRYAHC